MIDLEALKLANAIVNPYGLQAEFLGNVRSVGVGGDCRTYTRAIVLTGALPVPDYDTLRSLATQIGNTTRINRITIEITSRVIDGGKGPE